MYKRVVVNHGISTTISTGERRSFCSSTSGVSTSINDPYVWYWLGLKEAFSLPLFCYGWYHGSIYVAKWCQPKLTNIAVQFTKSTYCRFIIIHAFPLPPKKNAVFVDKQKTPLEYLESIFSWEVWLVQIIKSFADFGSSWTPGGFRGGDRPSRWWATGGGLVGVERGYRGSPRCCV